MQLLSTGNPEASELDGRDHEVTTSSSELIQKWKKKKKRHGLAVAPTNSAAVVAYT